MRLLPEPLRTRLQNRFWRLISKRRPHFSEFGGEANDEARSNYRGRAADIFFSHEGDVVHKWLHYLPVYDEAFSRYVDAPIKFLEIGVSRGGSLAMWRKFFGQQAVIFGIDIDPNCAQFDGKSANVRIGSQADPAFLKQVVAEMGGLDVVLDDGSHVASHQRTSFETLFPMLAQDGVYVIEDLHTAYWPQLEGGLRRSGTAIEFLKDKIDVLHRHYYQRGLNTPAAMSDIESVQFFDSIAIIRKRKQLPRRHVAVPAPGS